MLHSPVGASAPVCPLCEREVRGAADSYITSCQHEYHKKCIESHFKGSENCPVCLVPCKPAGPQTRAKGLILEEGLIQPSAVEKARSSKSKERERSETSQPHFEGTSSWLHMERRLLTTLSDKLVKLVQSSVEESFRQLAATPAIKNANSEIRPTSPSRATEGQNRPYERNLNNRNDTAAVNNAGSPISHRSIGSDLNYRPDKVVQILNGWKLKY